MPKMTDQEFDHLFQQAANRISPEQQQGDWEDMQHRLEAAERDARARNISLYSMLVLLLLYSFVVPEDFKSGRSDQASLVPKVEQLQQAEPTGLTGAGDKTINNDDAVSSDEGVVGSGKSNGSVTQGSSNGNDIAGSGGVDSGNDAVGRGDDSKNSSDPATEKQNDANAPVDQASDAEVASTATKGRQADKGANAKSTSASAKQHDVSGDKRVAGEQSIAGAGNARTGRPNKADHSNASGITGAAAAGTAGVVAGQAAGTPSAKINSGTAEHSSNDGASGVNNGKAGPQEGSFVTASAVAINTPSTDPLFAEPELQAKGLKLRSPGTVVVSQSTARHPLFVKLAISPDFSSIDYGSAGKTGVNFGPMVEYGLSPRFGISTGAIWSKKLYDQENPSKTYNQGGGYPLHAKMLNGDCRILDIPLNVTYYMLPGRKTSLFVTVGSSSYIMLNEEYVYTVTHNNKDYEYVESYSHENNEWFSMLNLSTGIQHQVGKRWFVQGEPFLKAPMKGIGAGKVNLVSAGVFVSVKYWIR
ncbi:outer membrane beta-barrel protein [Chryseolinea sp. T2]|uniref:outer membrane beta-barrel protein n=1 Tax=Chryseolinea sp. T2 TaxID=3129255 RepID=UPI00307823A0